MAPYFEAAGGKLKYRSGKANPGYGEPPRGQFFFFNPEDRRRGEQALNGCNIDAQFARFR
jgi:hypothetical protein